MGRETFSDKCVSIVRLKQLLGEAAWRHPSDAWIDRAEALFPGFQSHFVPPCSGSFNKPPHCDEAHSHSLRCGNAGDICVLCGKTKGEHRAAWAALE